VNLWAWIAVAVLGGLGAVARFLLDGWVGNRFGRELPLGTFAINVSGSFLLGLLDGLALSGEAMVIAGTATIGAYTTFSTWMVETQRIDEAGRRRIAVTNLVLSIVLGLAAAALGHAIGAQL
jgi:fluoride exporter